MVRGFCRIAAAAGLALLAACGGGGSSEAPPTNNPPPPPPPITKVEAFRFLNQATFGPTDATAQQVITQRYEAWIDGQLAQPASLQLDEVQAAFALLSRPVMNVGQLHQDRVAAWFSNSVRGPDQLRQRVAFALSETMVVSEVALNQYPWAVADYYDMLARNAFGDFRKLLEDVTLHPAMGVYLSMLGNQKPNLALNIRPDENYARELMQLFSIGLVELNPDGTTRLDTQGQPIPTFDQAVIEGFAHVYTGWSWAGAVNFGQARATIANQVQPMQAYPEQHDTGSKRVLSYPGAALTIIPGGQTPQKDLADALDNIFNHPNVGPFIARRLILRLVTSNPSPEYVSRIARVFNNDGNGRRGNLGAVVRAILLDAEARNASTNATHGKTKEPLIRLTQLWRAYDASSGSGVLTIPGASFIFGQGPLQAQSVFNFFSPFYAPPGEIAAGGLVAPELQIATEYLNTQVTNYFFATAVCYVPQPLSFCPVVRPETVIIDTAAELALAGNPPALVDKVADRLLAGQIPASLRTAAIAQVERAPVSLPTLRVAEAIFLISTSPDYVVQP
jgi:uncharacterized protein (DUF1800 family)